MSSTTINEIMSEKASELIRELTQESGGSRKKVIDNVITVMGAAGGTGTSTLVANVANVMSKQGLLVLIIDMNICYPIHHSFFRVPQKAGKKDLVSYLLGKNPIGDSIDYRGNIGVITANNKGLPDLINCENSVCVKNVEMAISDMRDIFDVVLIDCPLKIESELINTVIYKSDFVYTIWDEGVGCISNMERLMRNLAMVGVDLYKMKAIMNKKTSIYYPKSIFSKLKVNLIDTLPFDTSIIESALRGEIFCKSGASSNETAAEFEIGMKRLVEKMLDISGYARDVREPVKAENDTGNVEE